MEKETYYCTLCLNDFPLEQDRHVTLKCKHTYCGSCLIKMYLEGGNSSAAVVMLCPLCKRPIREIHMGTQAEAQAFYTDTLRRAIEDGKIDGVSLASKADQEWRRNVLIWGSVALFVQFVLGVLALGVVVILNTTEE